MTMLPRALDCKELDQQRYNFQFGGAVVREIVKGKLGAMVRDAAYQSRTPDFWASCDGVGGPATYRLWGTSADGKGEPGQTNAVSHGCRRRGSARSPC